MAYSLEWMESKTKQYALHALPTHPHNDHLNSADLIITYCHSDSKLKFYKQIIH